MIKFDFIDRFLYPSTKRIVYEDHFLWGINSSGLVGELGWATAGTVTAPGGSGSNQGVYRFDTGAVSGTPARLSMATSASYDPAKTHSVTWVIKLNTNDTNTTCRYGAANSVAGAPPNNGIYFEKLDNDTNWFCNTRSGAVETRVDSGIAIQTTNYVTFQYIRDAQGVRFYINGTPVATNTANIPTTFIATYGYIINSAAASKTFDVDYFKFQMVGLT